MNQQNQRIERGLAQAILCVKQLEAKGCTVVDVIVGHRNPLVRIDGDGAEQLGGALKSSMTIHGVTHRTMATRVEDCQVEWPESYTTNAREALQA